MDTIVDTRRGILLTTIKNHLLSAILWFFLSLLVFGWVIEGWEYGSTLVGIAATVFYMSGIYSYSYDQPKLDMIIKKKYDYLMPLKIGGCSSLFIFGLSGVHFLSRLFLTDIQVSQFGLLIRFLNYPFVYFFHGHDGSGFYVIPLIVISLIPIGVSYLSYYMSVHGISLTKFHDKIVYEKKDKK
ncbi:MAG: hypothetical protein E7411_00880 [Ruminococcaceae bacterium]|nr:hypothetical protein [Oscillospiraceae bacterium]